MLTLSWSDGNTLISVNSCLVASSKVSNIIGPAKTFDKRIIAGQRRKLDQTKAPEVMLTLLETAVSSGLSADYVLFDCWFANPAQITAIKSRDIDVMVGKEIIRIYGKRRQIEVFFKTCKSMLNLIGECHSLSYDALTAHTAIVFTRYMLLALEQRQNEDQRILGELFFFLADEMADITFSRSLCILNLNFIFKFFSWHRFGTASSILCYSIHLFLDIKRASRFLGKPHKRTSKMLRVPSVAGIR